MNRLLSFWRKAPPLGAGPPSVPAGHRIYAVGDIHGHDDLLQDLLARIEADNAARPRAKVTIVYLGDLIDRGPGSAEVVERLRTYRPPGIRQVFIAGNHEEVLLRILGGEAGLVGDWLRFGGAQCARSYGLDPSRLAKMSAAAVIRALGEAIPENHVAFLEEFVDTFRAGDYLFVHAGIRPGVAIADQIQADLRWIRGPFLDHPEPHDVMVVHGHTISEEVDERPGRIGIDTGAYRHGRLTALALDGRDRWTLQVEVAAPTGSFASAR